MNVPAAERFRFCPGCGVAVEAQTDVRCFRCVTCGFSLWFNASASVSAIVTDGAGRVLVLVRSRDPGKGLWTLPGGFVEPGEDAESALRREVCEETGILLGGLDWVAAYPNRYGYGGIVYPTLDLVFHAGLPEGAELAMSDEALAFAWENPRELVPERFAFGSLARAVADFRETFGAQPRLRC